MPNETNDPQRQRHSNTNGPWIDVPPKPIRRLISNDPAANSASKGQ